MLGKRISLGPLAIGDIYKAMEESEVTWREGEM